MNEKITPQVVADKLRAYLHHELSVEQLVDWAEDALNKGELEAHNSETLRDIIARLGLADVREFGLSWDDCYEFLAQMGYQVQVRVTPAAA